MFSVFELNFPLGLTAVALSVFDRHDDCVDFDNNLVAEISRRGFQTARIV